MDKKTLKQFQVWGSIGGKTSASKMTPEQRRKRATDAGKAKGKKSGDNFSK